MATINGTSGNNTLNGTNSADSISGFGGNDTLMGLDGNDTLVGGIGIDIMYGGKGNDTYYVDDVSDEAIEDGFDPHQGSQDTVIASVGFTLGVNVENLTLTGSANINGKGNGSANVLIGNTGNNWLDGGTSVDTLKGGQGDDTYTVDYTDYVSVYDTVVENIGGGTDTVLLVAAGQGVWKDYTLPDYVENVIVQYRSA